MSVDVQTQIVVQRPRMAVAEFASNPEHAPEWYVNIDSVEWQTDPVVAVGSRAAFIARFLGRRLAYTLRFAAVYSASCYVPAQREPGPVRLRRNPHPRG
jgi:hypothetical protein